MVASSRRKALRRWVSEMRMLATCRPARLKDFYGEVQVIVWAAAASLREAKGVVAKPGRARSA